MGDQATIKDVDLAGKTALVRVDFNIPFLPGTIEISDDSRIRASLPTIQYLREQGCKTVLCSHLGRPKGRVVEELRMAPVSRRLSEMLDTSVTQAPDCVGPGVRELVEGLEPGDVLLLENLRFHSEEEQNDAEFAEALGSLADIYVNDAFGAAHRAHASTVGITNVLPAVAGLLMDRELEMLGAALDSPRRPFAAILGGVKVSDKMGVLQRLAPKVEMLMIGGGMAATFFRAEGLEVGESTVEEDRLSTADEIIRTAGQRLFLPMDAVVADAFSSEAKHRVVDVSDIPQGWRIMDIGPKTTAAYEDKVTQAQTVVWNGPMGVCEWEPFAQGTVRIATALARMAHATTVVGGGSTSEAVTTLGLNSKMTHVSTGGGASLEFLEGKTLPGVDVLMDREAVAS